MKTTTVLSYKTLLVLAALALLTACGSSNSSNNSNSATTSATGTLTTTSSEALAYCNAGNQNGFTANITSYVNTDNSIRPDYIRMKITQIPADFTSGSYIYFYRWQTNYSSGAVSLDTTPLNYRIEANDGTVLINFQSGLTWGSLTEIAQTWGISDPTTLLNDLVFTIDTRDTTSSYEVLKVAYYNSSNTNEVDLNMLMPIFAANPTTYATRADGTAQWQVLQALHPFESQMNNGYADSYFQQLDAAMCF